VKFIDEIEKAKAGDERELESSRWTLDLGVRQRLADNVTLFFDAVNVTNEPKEKFKFKGSEFEHEVESTGRTFFLGVEATF